MSEHAIGLLRSVAGGLGFVGVFGFCLDASEYPVLVGLITSSILLYTFTFTKKKVTTHE
ncbi:hypothetical protein UFOVP45_107 [uncultured Caudovirales phage]|uniref:Uncharacterized protein n=1 Tax=uncultured Caudovirales phage TaxID=2100421 RepID=A0A6J5KQ64_9CAUD|nr:hypothetical protein UFOVP45_107 [uncultured Caudovirales phage]